MEDNAEEKAQEQAAVLKESRFLGSPYIHLLIIALLSIIAYSNTFNVPFIFDDAETIVENPIIRDVSYFLEPSKAKGLEISGAGLYEALMSRFIGYLTFAMNYRLYGLDVTSYHILNLAIHILSTFLVYYLVLITFRTREMENSCLAESSILIALFSGLLFAVHPIQTQAVTYIVQRFASLAALFYLSSLVCYIQARLSVRNVSRCLFYVLSFIFAVSAMKTKEVSFTLPVTIVMYEFMFFREKTAKRLVYLLPILLTMFIIPLTFVELDRPVEELMGDIADSTTISEISRTDYLMTEFRVIVTYIRLLFFPVGQNLDYDYPVYHSFLNPHVLISFLFLVCIFSLGVFLLLRSRSRDTSLRLMAFGIFWFFITLSVESSVIPLHVIYEHRVYLPSAGIFMLISTFIFIAAHKLDAKKKAMVISVLSILIIVLAGATYARNITWGSKISLWEDVVSKSPNKARGYNNLGIAYHSQGLIDKSIEQFRKVITLSKSNFEAHNNLGFAYQLQGLFNEAIEQYRIAIGLNPDYARAHYNLGNVYKSTGAYSKAIQKFIIAYNINPDIPDIYYHIGVSYHAQGLFKKAVESYRTALKSMPDFPDIYNNLGAAYESQGLSNEAVESYKGAVRLRPDWTVPRINLGRIYIKHGENGKAREMLEKILRIDPRHQGARNLLNSIMKENSSR